MNIPFIELHCSNENSKFSIDYQTQKRKFDNHQEMQRKTKVYLTGNLTVCLFILSENIIDQVELSRKKLKYYIIKQYREYVIMNH